MFAANENYLSAIKYQAANNRKTHVISIYMEKIKLCCNWSCKSYPSNEDKCYSIDFKCLWFANANDNLLKQLKQEMVKESIDTINNEFI